MSARMAELVLDDLGAAVRAGPVSAKPLVPSDDGIGLHDDQGGRQSANFWR